MAPLTARRVDEDADDLLANDEQDLDTDLNDQPEKTGTGVTPAVSDRRRRRQIKRGEIVESASEPDEDDDAEDEAISPTRKDRPTPSQRDEKKEVSGNFIARFIANVEAYIADTRGELLKVSWPTREETQRLSYIVLIVTAIAAAFLGIVSYIFSFLTTQIAGQGTTSIAGFFAIVLVIVVAGFWLLRDRFFGSID